MLKYGRTHTDESRFFPSFCFPIQKRVYCRQYRCRLLCVTRTKQFACVVTIFQPFRVPSLCRLYTLHRHIYKEEKREKWINECVLRVRERRRGRTQQKQNQNGKKSMNVILLMCVLIVYTSLCACACVWLFVCLYLCLCV